MADATWGHKPGESGTGTVDTVGDLSAQKVASLADEWRKATMAAERQYWINRAFLANEQWVYWNEGSEQLLPAPPDNERVRVTFDLLKPATRRIQAKLLKRPLVFEVQAGGSDDASIGGARLGAGVLRHVHRAHNWESLRAEFLSMDIALAIVDGVDGAIAHINEYGTGHTEAIVTTDLAAAQRFTERVDAAAVMVNASTAFTDGEQFGFGAEIGISTQKLHARGPMGLPELTSTKWIVWGDGHTRPA